MFSFSSKTSTDKLSASHSPGEGGGAGGLDGFGGSGGLCVTGGLGPNDQRKKIRKRHV